MITREYDSIVRKVIPNYESLLRRMALEANPTSRVLELGIGTGNFASEVIQRTPSVSYTGVDSEKTYLELARKKLGNSISLVQGDILADNLGENYDLVLCSLVTHHFPEAKLISLNKRVRESLKAGGSFVGLELVRTGRFESEWFEFMTDNGLSEETARRILDEDYEIVTKERLIESLKEAGFSKVSVLREVGNLVIYKAEVENVIS